MEGVKSILYFAPCNNYHTYKWAKYFSLFGYRVDVASLEQCESNEIKNLPNVDVHWLGSSSNPRGGSLQKLGYLATVNKAKSLINELNPNIIHAHFASSYGLVCSLACNRPFYLSVWGNDVYEFPRKSYVHRRILSYVLKKCSWLFSTSAAMAEETKKYVDKPITVTPFGVDMELFHPSLRDRNGDQTIVVGTVKALERKYGINTLLEAFAIVCNRRPDVDFKLRIAGKGTIEEELKELAERLELAEKVTWLGFVPQEQAAWEWANFDIGVVASENESESFGVSAVECQACGTPLVITDIPGLMEACDGGRSALVVPRRNPKALADAIETLADDPARMERMRLAERNYAERTYEIRDCFRRVESIYLRNLETGR